jgi:hypothetical protein
MRQRATRFALLVIGTAALTACTKTAVVREVQTTRAIETFSIQAIRGRYPPNLDSEEAKLVEAYRPVERIAARVQEWAKELGMWGSPDVLTLEVDRLRLPARWETSRHGPIVIGSAVGYRGEDHLGMHVDVSRYDENLFELDILRSIATFERRWPELFSSDFAMNAMIDELAWQVMYELSPPGHDEGVILLGHENGVDTATIVAARRGLLSYGTMLKESAAGTFRWSLLDAGCGSVLAKPAWVPWFVWAPFTYKSCQARAAEHAQRRDLPKDWQDEGRSDSTLE